MMMSDNVVYRQTKWTRIDLDRKFGTNQGRMWSAWYVVRCRTPMHGLCLGVAALGISVLVSQGDAKIEQTKFVLCTVSLHFGILLD